MITQIHLRHFKCFEKLDLPLGKFTLLTGHNSAGKTSIIQSMLFLRQNLVKGNHTNVFSLNGTSVSLGTFREVLDDLSGRDKFEIGVSTEKQEIEIDFESEDKTSLQANIMEIRISENEEQETFEKDDIVSLLFGKQGVNGKDISQERATLKNILHVSTERIGPQVSYSAPVDDTNMGLGAKGENTAWYLSKNGEQDVSKSLCDAGTPPTLHRQAAFWFAHFFPNATFNVEQFKGSLGTPAVELKFRSTPKGAWHSPVNVGYGFTHLLPVIVGGLGVQPGNLLIIENPEAHLHPSAQTEIGIFLAKVAAAGAQVIVETHSDHVLNGVRLAVKKGALSPSDLQIHYFNPRNTQPRWVTPMISADGALDSWPKGFFDQLEKDLDQLTNFQNIPPENTDDFI
jgi:predicted ATPase